MAPHPDRGAARRRHPGRLQDRRVRPRQAPRMGLEGRDRRRVRSPAQLSGRQTRRCKTQPAASSRSTWTRERSPSDKDSASPSAFGAFHGYGVSGDVPDRSSMRTTDARRLRRAREDGRRRQGQDRPGPLRRALPRLEGPQRPEARGQGNPDLLRPGRRRVCQGGRLSAGSVPAGLGDPARQRAVPVARPGDPSTPGWPSVKGAKRLPIDRVISADFPSLGRPGKPGRSRPA